MDSQYAVNAAPIANALSALNENSRVEVALSHELVKLLSEELYQSPLKAIEELIVNSYDADAQQCRVFVPVLPTTADGNFVAVFDNGSGMSTEGLQDLWHIGHSTKRSAEVEKRRKRKQIGKFGIGKLATYTIAKKLTYITRQNTSILSVTVNFEEFASSPTGSKTLLSVPVRSIDDWSTLARDPQVCTVFELLGIEPDSLGTNAFPTWTLALLEGLKEKVQQIQIGDLRWVLRTAMPMRADFQLYLNGDKVESSKEDYEKLVEFQLHELPSTRLNSISKNTGEIWSPKEVGGEVCLISPSFPTGIKGSVIVTRRMLGGGKSDDLTRSHGYFVRVRERLVNDTDALFGLAPLVHGTFGRFRADIQADDLDTTLKASRETIEESTLKNKFRTLLREVFNEADNRYQQAEKSLNVPRGSREGDLQTVPPRLVEQPLADALLSGLQDDRGSEADDSWFYIASNPEADMSKIAHKLYTSRQKYIYTYTQRGKSARLVEFDPVNGQFWINQDHELVQEYGNQAHTQTLLEDFATAEALLEVYLRESQIHPHIIGNILERRDALLRSLVRDHIYSPSMVAMSLRESANDETKLEINLVVAARTLGFVATHISGAGEPDGIARFTDYPGGEKVITLEAKSSTSVPGLPAIDFAGLREHITNHNADGCLLVAPAYPGQKKEAEHSAVSKRAKEQRISCWTVSQLADFVEQTQSRQLNARQMLNIVLNAFTPDEVTQAVDKLFSELPINSEELYRAIVKSLRKLQGRMATSPRTVQMVATELTSNPDFEAIELETVEKAIRTLSLTSQGGMVLSDNGNILINVSFDELERRVSSLTRNSGEPRTKSGFRNYEKSEGNS